MATHKRSIYLQIIPIPEAHKIIESLPLKTPPIQYIPTQESTGYVLAETLYAVCSSPNHNSAAMDGIAVRAEDTYSAREDNPLILEEGKDFLYINTGNTLPEGYNAVIMIEYVIKNTKTSVRIESPAYKWQHVRKIGEDIIATQLILPKHHVITPHDIGYILTAGIFEIPVYAHTRVCIIPTGDELSAIENRMIPKIGHVIESNSHMLKALLSHFTTAITIIPRVKDSQEDIIKALEQAIHDGYSLILLCAGSSAGSKDFAKYAIESIGEILFHGIKAMPGKPSMLGIANSIPIVGIPGYPGSTAVCFETIITPLLEKITYKSAKKKEIIQANLVQDVPSKLGIQEFIKVRLGNVNKRYIAIPLPKATGSTSTLSLAEGICTIPAHKEGLSSNELIDIELYIPKQQIEHAIVCIGSHDDSLDIIDALLHEHTPFRLRTVHTGSMGGIYALKNNSTHCAGMHLLHKESKEFTIPYLEKYLPEQPFILYTLAMRQQCIYVQKGNPKNIQSLFDIVEKEASFINRQYGSGTRVLFDSLLESQGILPNQIQGYYTEEYSHLATALHVASGHADCAIGIYSAGKSLDLECIPLTEERYELVIPKEYQDLDSIQALYECINSSRYTDALATLGGYDTNMTASIREVLAQ